MTPAAAVSPARLTLVYDESCELCRRCRHWLEWQPKFVTMEFLAAADPAARERFGPLPWFGAELVVVDERGRTWIGPAAFLVCLWATKDWREWSYRLSGPVLAPLAERFFGAVSARRKNLSRWLAPSSCEDGNCRHRRVRR